MNSTFSTAAIVWMATTIEMHDSGRNGFGAQPDVLRQVRGRGWYKSVRGWLMLTLKGRAEIPIVCPGAITAAAPR